MMLDRIYKVLVRDLCTFCFVITYVLLKESVNGLKRVWMEPIFPPFCRSLDKNEYVEFENAKLNIREKTSFGNINKVLARADQYGAGRVGGVGYHPKRQVYVFVTVSQNGKKNMMVVFDAETGRKISESRNWEK
jgi:hypothetical protein